MGKPFKGIYFVLFASSEEAVKHCDILSCFMVPCKEVIFSSDFMESFP